MENQNESGPQPKLAKRERQTLTQQPPQNIFVTHTLILSKLNRCYSNTSSLEDFLQSLLRTVIFKGFQTIHFFKHQKGKSHAIQYEITNARKTAKEVTVNHFTSLFQRIKKSKNRRFGQESPVGFDFEILGTFMAHEFSLENHNVIFVISRNDFLDQTKMEKESFSKMITCLPPYLEKKLSQEITSQQRRYIEIITDHLPEDDLSYIDQADVFQQERVALLGDLLNTLKHELSNPLFGLELCAQILKQELNGEQGSFASEIYNSIKRCQAIMTNFTDLYTINEELSLADFRKLTLEVFTLTKSESSNIKKELHISDEIPEFYTIKGNSVWLAQILFNLVLNSIHALKKFGSDSPHITVTVLIKNELEIHVQDNGPGIDPINQKEIFRPFFTTKKKGTGLGLAISKNLSSKLNGNLSCICQGQGAHFVLRLPA